MNPIAVVIPTFRRPEGLSRALESVFGQDARDLIAEIIVVDNSPEGSAAGTVAALRPSSPWPLIYVAAPTPGVATARNAGVAAVSAPLVAFLDDDEAAHPGWLRALYDTHMAVGSAVTFGPVCGRAPSAPDWKRPYLETFFSRFGPATSGPTDSVYGCGNSIMGKAEVLGGPEPFQTAADHTGGEDDRLFSDLKAAGARFGWAAEGGVDEFAPESRARLSYAFARAVGYGQAPGQIAARHRDWPGLARWTLIGVAQTLVYGLAAVAALPFGRGRAIVLADRAARGLGKVLWFADLQFYGRAAAKSAEPPPAAGATATLSLEKTAA